MRQIPVRSIKEQVDLALWELDLGGEPGSVVRSMLYRMRQLATQHEAGGWRFRLQMLLRRDRGGISW